MAFITGIGFGPDDRDAEIEKASDFLLKLLTLLTK